MSSQVFFFIWVNRKFVFSSFIGELLGCICLTEINRTIVLGNLNSIPPISQGFFFFDTNFPCLVLTLDNEDKRLTIGKDGF